MRKRLTKAGRIASADEKEQVKAFKNGMPVRIGKAIKNLYRLPSKFRRKKVTSKSEKPGESIQEMAKRVLGLD